MLLVVVFLEFMRFRPLLSYFRGEELPRRFSAAATWLISSWEPVRAEMFYVTNSYAIAELS